MKRFFLLLLLTICSAAYSQTLSPESEISLLTVSPGDELWSFAGHTAMRIKDPANDLDVNFNYGVFDFRAESFYFRFLRGTLPYQIGAYNSRDELWYWINTEKRGVTEQTLNLSLKQRQKIYDFLLENYQPENREYNYKFFYDNCSSRFRDVLENALEDSLKLSTTLNTDKSYREWIRYYSDSCRNDWAKFGMDLLIGIPSDENTVAMGAMFIPDNLMSAFDSAHVFSDGQWKPLVSQKLALSDNHVEMASLPVKPFTFFSALFLIILYASYLEHKNGRWFLWLDRLLFSITGIAGIVILLLWFFTNHGVTSNNLNILWAFPPVLPAVWAISGKQSPGKMTVNAFMIQMILCLIVLIGFTFLPQSFSLSIIPIAGIVLTRSYLIWKKASLKISARM